MSSDRPTEIRLSLRAAMALFVVPQVCTVAALAALFLVGPDRAATLREHRQAQAETIPPPPFAIPTLPVAAPPSAPPARPAPPTQTINMPHLLERLLAPRDHQIAPAQRPSPLNASPETRQALGTRLRAEIEDGFADLDAFERPDRAQGDNSGRLDEIRALIAELQALQTSFATLRSGGGGGGRAGGAGGAGGALGGLGDALGQVMPLLDTLQNLRDGRLGQDSASLNTLDGFLGRDQERPRRLALLLLLAWTLEDDADA